MREELSYLDEDLDEDEEDTLEDRFLIFSIEDRNYGIEIKYITEIVGLQAITEVPDMPDYVKGVINLRGKIIPLIDMRLRFKLRESTYNDKTCVVILNIQNQTIGLIVDTVREVLRIGKEEKEDSPSFGNQNGNRFVQSLAKVKTGVKVLLDVQQLFAAEDAEKVGTALQEIN